MKSVVLALIGALALPGTAFAQVPSTNDTSDTHYNTGMGSFTLGALASGSCQWSPAPVGCFNTASGYGALYNNTVGSVNTASGAFALATNTTGNYNTASGYQALDSNTTGSYNAAPGCDALYSNTTGSKNIGSAHVSPR